MAMPVLRNMAEKAVLDLVPLGSSGREVAHRDRQPGLVGQVLKLAFPQSHAGSIGAAAVGRDHQPGGRGIERSRPFLLNQERMALTANSAVSLVTPTLTQPLLSARS